jgi:hypothetical protein
MDKDKGEQQEEYHRVTVYLPPAAYELLKWIAVDRRRTIAAQGGLLLESALEAAAEERPI